MSHDGAIDVALGLELFAELGLVVELAVVGDPDRAVLVGHGLGAAGQVDDRQPAMPERRGTVDSRNRRRQGPR